MNIAEGNTKRTKKEKSHYFDTALASLEELHCQLRLSWDLKYITKEDFDQHDSHIKRSSYLITKLRQSLKQPPLSSASSASSDSSASST